MYSNNELYEVVEQSICPAGWTLPRIGEGEDTFLPLWEQYGIDDYTISDTTDLTGNSLYFTIGGSFDGILSYIGHNGNFWTSVSYSSSNAYFAHFAINGYAHSSLIDSQGYGDSIRCIARPVSASIDYGNDI